MPGLIAGYWANWGLDNRFSTYRVPAERGAATRIENRMPCGTASPYLAAAATLNAALLGVVDGADCGAPQVGDADAAPNTDRHTPHTLAEALDAVEADTVLTEAMGPDLVAAYLALRRHEVGPLGGHRRGLGPGEDHRLGARQLPPLLLTASPAPALCEDKRQAADVIAHADLGGARRPSRVRRLREDKRQSADVIAHAARCERLADGRDHVRRVLDDLLVGELVRRSTGGHEGVEPLRVVPQLGLRTVEAVAEELDDDVGAGEAAVDADQTVTGRGQDLLGGGRRQIGVGEEAQESSFQPTVPAAGDLVAGQDVQQCGDPVATAGSERADAPVQQVFVDEAVAERRVDRPSERLGPFGAAEVDHRPGRARHRVPLGVGPIDEGQHGGGVDDDAEAAHVAIALQGEVERRPEREAVEPVQRGGRGPGHPDRVTHVEDERGEIAERAAGGEGGAEGVGADWFEDAALDSASKLAVAQTGGVCLLAGEGTQLTCRDRRNDDGGRWSCGHSTPWVSASSVGPERGQTRF